MVKVRKAFLLLTFQGCVSFCEAWRMSGGGGFTNSDNAGQGGGGGRSENPLFGRPFFVNGTLVNM